MIGSASRIDEVKKLKRIKTLLVRNLLIVEQRLLKPVKKGGEKYASI